MNKEKNHWPAPWAAVHSRYQNRYSQVVYIYWHENLVELDAGWPTPLPFDDPVLSGFARKAATAMRNTCQGCGSVGRVRRRAGLVSVECGSCFGKSQIVSQVQALLEECGGSSRDPFSGPRSAWHEHELPEPLKSSLPSSSWRHTFPPGLQPIRYLAREDINRLTPWLQRLAALMR